MRTDRKLPVYGFAWLHVITQRHGTQEQPRQVQTSVAANRFMNTAFSPAAFFGRWDGSIFFRRMSAEAGEPRRAKFFVTYCKFSVNFVN